MTQSDETSRDLLFGLLALQVGMIDQDQLVAAFAAWSRGEGKALSQILVERGAIDNEGRFILGLMAEKQLKAHGGDATKSLASIVVDPSTREQLESLADTDLTRTLAHVRESTPNPTLDDTATLSIRAASGDGQRFRVLRPHARGGLGVVYVALDGELNREVALKQILDHHADDPATRTRFVVEAEITGGLEHPGIVPVYGLGHHADGRPYYAMRFIKGDSLKEAIAAFHAEGGRDLDPGRRSLALRLLLRRFVDVCNAIAYAHGRGVLHRDIKPGNVIVGKYGETLVVDWGLAKPVGKPEGGPGEERTLRPSSASGSVETLPGSALGTPSYMSPEQAEGDLDRLGPRSDVYSLGATLYSLLTGRAPFEGVNLMAILVAVRAGTFPPPRQIAPEIDRALEAVCLKAMAKRPEDRHETARALADDVELWMADEPVSAWREPRTRRARRWMRRHRTAVTAAVAALLMAVVGLASVLVVKSRANADLSAKNEELDRLNGDLRNANSRVETRFELARDAIRSFSDAVEQQGLLKNPSLKPVRDTLLRSAAGFYERLETLLQAQADRGSRAALAQSYMDLGDVIQEIGARPEALAAFRKALAIRRELAGAADAGAGAKIDLALSLTAEGTLARQLGDNARALAAFLEAKNLVSPLAAEPGGIDAARVFLGNSCIGLGDVLLDVGKSPESLASFAEAVAIRRKLAGAKPDVVEFRRDLARSLHNLATVQNMVGLIPEALASFGEALAIQRKLVDQSPKVAEYRRDLARGLYQIALVQDRVGLAAEAFASFSEALNLRRKLSEESPTSTEARDELSKSHIGMGSNLEQAGRIPEAIASYTEALSILGKLNDENPAVTEFRSGKALAHTFLAGTQRQAGRKAEALSSLIEAMKIHRGLVDESPTNARCRADLARAHYNIAVTHEDDGRLADALASYGEARTILLLLVANDPTAILTLGELARCHSSIGDIHARMRNVADAIDSYRRSLEILEGLVRDQPRIAAYQRELLATHGRTGKLLAREMDHAGAVAQYRRVLELQMQIPPSPVAVYSLGCVRSLLAGSLAQLGPDSAAEAEAEARAAVALLARAIEAGFRNPAQYQGDINLNPLRARPDFQLLLLDLSFPANPLAP